MTVQLRRFTTDDLPAVRPVLLDVYAEVYADELHIPFTSLDRFDRRLTNHSAGDGWEAVIGYDGDRPVGYAYGAPLGRGARWWSHMTTPLPEGFADEDGRRTLALFELMVRAPWQGTGAARRIHEELLRPRPEERVTLLCDPEHPGVLALYESWGYRRVGDQRPFPDSPSFSVMVRELGGRSGSPHIIL
ncbi:GNAT family N-acetyltransferase [Streptomyces sp. BE147]|uniref:GNAT family N-acetyltransferase n=1 Tax=unclassified Streptomyces TaxID=2593676 RepID=UPI002E772E0D|nr:GNAT family N-acetyltransferase [Streptomyces sp. BE147]MEE1741686.1 N-acetyltransferase [Streptomyces sp. BE147]